MLFRREKLGLHFGNLGEGEVKAFLRRDRLGRACVALVGKGAQALFVQALLALRLLAHAAR